MKFRKAELSLSDLAVLLGVLGFLFLVASHYFQTADPWASSLAQNLGSSFLFAVLALVVIDKIVSNYQHRQDQRAWAAVQGHVGHYVGNVARQPMRTYRMALRISDAAIMEAVPNTDPPTVQHVKTADWIDNVLIPELPRLARLTRADWTELLKNLGEDSADAREVLLLYGSRLPPEIHEQVIEIRRGITRAHHNVELYGSLLGNEDEIPVVTPDMRAFALYEIARSNGKSHLKALWWCRVTAVDDAVTEATHLLRSSAKLLRLLASNYLQDDPSGPAAITNGAETGRTDALPSGDQIVVDDLLGGNVNRIAKPTPLVRDEESDGVELKK